MNHLYFSGALFCYALTLVKTQFNDICDRNNGKRFYLEYGDSGTLYADFQNNVWYAQRKNTNNNRCAVQYITCPSCVIDIKFRFLNISRNCGKASVFDTCGCDYVWIYEPPIEDASGEEFCGKFIRNNVSELNYVSQTQTVAVTFIYNSEYGHAFTLEYFTKRNRVQLTGYPVTGNINNGSQFIQSPFFSHLYPIDLSVEYVINCVSADRCRISLLFSDFLLADSSIIEIFNWNGQRISVITGNKFRPPILISTGPALVIRFYANGVSSLGFKAFYSFILGNLEDSRLKPNISCGGYVSNLGGAITMMSMVDVGTKFFDCIWIIKPIENFRHRKTHLYVKVVNFSDFVGTTELVIRQGLTSTQPSVELLRYPMTHFSSVKQSEHVIQINKGFYISLRGHFRPTSYLGIVYAAFNYKDCFAGSDFLCHNLRCISGFLNCDGFDHCGDDSDESLRCSEDPKDRRQFSKMPNFFFPEVEPYSDITTATLVFLTCSFGLIGIILAMALLMYRVNVRARHQRQIQDHIETIHAILEEGVGDVEEEIMAPDDPPGYEAPPGYEEIIKLQYMKSISVINLNSNKCSHCNLRKPPENFVDVRSPRNTAELCDVECIHPCASSSLASQETPPKILGSPPPSYENIRNICEEKTEQVLCQNILQPQIIQCESPLPGPSYLSVQCEDLEDGANNLTPMNEEKSAKYLQRYRTQFINEIRKSFRSCKSTNFVKQARKAMSLSEENLVRYFSESHLISTSNKNANSQTIGCKLKKSFSTDDISLL